VAGKEGALMAKLKRRTAILIASAAACSMLLLAGAAPGVAGAQQVRVHGTGQSQRAVLRYWTPKRMRKATPVDLLIPRRARSRAATPAPQGPPVLIPGRPPASAGVAPRSTGTDFETNPADDTTFPNRVHGKIFMTTTGGVNAKCSGTVVDSPHGNVVVTAAHCIYTGGYFTNFVFVPGYRNGNAPLGVWSAKQLIAPSGWIANSVTGPSTANDIGIAVMNPRLGKTIEAAVGARGIAFNLNANNSWQVFGYPAHPNATEDNGYDHGPGDYDGSRLIGCNVTYFGSDYPGTLKASFCYMREGASGGGWVVAGTNYLNSVTSYLAGPCPAGYTDGCGKIGAPYFGTIAQNLYNAGVAAGAPPPPPLTGQRAAALKKCKKKHSHKKRKKCKKRAIKLPI
jgi:V8-like Glu-specific endopeptidase